MWVDNNTQEVKTFRQILAENPNVMFPDGRTAEKEAALPNNIMHYTKCVAVNMPAPSTPLVKVVALPSVLISGLYVQQWGEEDKYQTLAEYKLYVSSKVNQTLDTLFWSDHPYNGTSVQFRNSEDRSNLTNLRQFADAGAPVQLILADNSIATIQPSDFIMLTNTIMSSRSALRIYARQLKNAVLAASTIEELNAVDIETGWPSIIPI